MKIPGHDYSCRQTRRGRLWQLGVDWMASPAALSACAIPTARCAECHVSKGPIGYLSQCDQSVTRTEMNRRCHGAYCGNGGAHRFAFGLPVGSRTTPVQGTLCF